MFKSLLSKAKDTADKMSPATVPQISFVGAIDQGTTSTRFIIFNPKGEVVAQHQLEFEQIYPHPGYVFPFN